MEYIIFDDGFDRQQIIFVGKVFKLCKIGNNIEWALIKKNIFKYPIINVNLIGNKFNRTVIFFRTPEVALQFGQTVFVYINHDQFINPIFQNSLDVGRADSTCIANNQYRFIGRTPNPEYSGFSFVSKNFSWSSYHSAK